ncbi:MAG: hypothetical protein JW863_22815 [Chitinispirillaceae bacterium]|nr:hypothetical protein [Chitinispirillaceae bacterium]
MNFHRPLCILALFSFFVLSFVPETGAATAFIDYTTKFQTIEGFGGGLSFHKYPYYHPKKDEIYDSLFNKMKINVIRVGNWYHPVLDTPCIEVPMMKEIQERWPEVKTMLTSWTPPPYLKSNDSIIGWTPERDTGTLKKNTDGTYMYDQYGDYWLQSVNYFLGNGMKIDWISIQNEPDWPAQHEGCVLEGRETPTIASYGKAHTAVYNKLKNGLVKMIPMIGPDVAGIYGDRVTRFITSPETNTDEMAAYCHHLYDHPGMEWFVNAQATITGKPIYQTEFLINEGQQHGDKILSWIDNALFMHQSLAVENASMYCVFALAYNPGSMHTFFSQDTLWGDWYETRNAYYVFKQFSANIRRGWKRIDAGSDDPSFLMSAYCNDNNDSAAVVFINLGNMQNQVNFSFPGKTATVIQTSNTRKYEQIATFTDMGTIPLDSVSVTTVNLATTAAVTRNPLQTLGNRGSITVTPIGGGRLLVTGRTTSGTTAVTLFDCRGTRIDEGVLPRTTGNTATCVFNRRLVPGTYLLKLSAPGTTLSRTVAVIE